MSQAELPSSKAKGLWKGRRNTQPLGHLKRGEAAEGSDEVPQKFVPKGARFSLEKSTSPKKLEGPKQKQ